MKNELSEIETAVQDFDNHLETLNRLKAGDPIDALIELSDKLYDAFEFGRRNKHKYGAKFGVLDKIDYLENSFMQTLSYLLKEQESDYLHTQSELKKVVDAGMWNEASEFRRKLDALGAQYGTLSDNILAKPLFERFGSSLLEQYLINTFEREEISEQLKAVKEQYTNTDWNNKSKDLLSAYINGKTRGLLGRFRKSPLGRTSLDDIISAFREIDYYEGVHDAQQLKADIEHTVENFEKIMDAKSYLTSVSAHGRNLLKNMPGDAAGLVKICRRFDIDFSMYNSAILSTKVKGCREISERITGKSMSLLADIADGLEQQYERIDINEFEKSQKLLNDYESFIRQTEGILDLKNRLPGISALRESIAQNYFDSRLRQIEELVACEPAVYEDVPTHVRHLEDARVDLESLSMPRSFLGRYNSLEAKISQDFKKWNQAMAEYASLEKEYEGIEKLGNRLGVLRKNIASSVTLHDARDFISLVSAADAYSKRTPGLSVLDDITGKFNNSLIKINADIESTYESMLRALQPKESTIRQKEADEIRKIKEILKPHFKVPEMKTPQYIVPKEPPTEMVQPMIGVMQPLGIEVMPQYHEPPILHTGAFQKTNGSFLIPLYLSIMDINTHYYWFNSTITSTRLSWEDKLETITGRFSDGRAPTIKDYDYVQHLFYALTESKNRGELASRYARSTVFRHSVDSCIESINDYISRSEFYLGLSPKDIEEHRPLISSKNHYNQELGFRI
jgi:hypothetical protein